MNVLEVENLHVSFQKENEFVNVLKGVNFSIKENTTLALVGESGCGKTLTARCIMNLITSDAIIKKGRIEFKGNDILRMKEEELQEIRGKQIAMIFQNPQAVLDPVFTIEKQIRECIVLEQKENKHDIKKRIIEVLESVQIGDTRRVMKSYPFQLSLGMCQRIMIAMAIASNARLWVIDEATSALDVHVQANILDLINKLKKERKLSMLFITHDLRILANISDDIAIMLDGEIIEVMSSTLFTTSDAPYHPYTQSLRKAMSFEECTTIQENKDIKHRIGCVYASRCSNCQEICFHQKPLMNKIHKEHAIKCHLYSTKGI